MKSLVNKPFFKTPCYDRLKHVPTACSYPNATKKRYIISYICTAVTGFQ